MNPASQWSDLALIVPFSLIVLVMFRQIQLKHRSLPKRVGIARSYLPRPFDWQRDS